MQAAAPSPEGALTRFSSRPARHLRAVLAAALFLPVSFLAAQPWEEGAFRPPDLVELTALDSTIRLDIRYATARNFMHRPMYAEARAFLQRPAARALLRAHRALLASGYGLLVFDAYRPWSVTKKFWDETPREKRKFVANPAKGSKHNRGCAVDCSLYDRASGAEVEMTSPYDDFTPRAAARFPGGTPSQHRARDFLRHAMESAGFAVNPDEWWHFDFREWKSYRVLDIPFAEITPPARPPAQRAP
jgi:D-alanyl-D-alanine dipeptidase